MTVETRFDLPEDLAREAQAFGLLSPEGLEQLVRDEIRRRRVDQLFDASDRLTRLAGPALTSAEIEAEIQTARAERRAANARRG